MKPLLISSSLVELTRSNQNPRQLNTCGNIIPNKCNLIQYHEQDQRIEKVETFL